MATSSEINFSITFLLKAWKSSYVVDLTLSDICFLHAYGVVLLMNESHFNELSPLW